MVSDGVSPSGRGRRTKEAQFTVAVAAGKDRSPRGKPGNKKESQNQGLSVNIKGLLLVTHFQQVRPSS